MQVTIKGAYGETNFGDDLLMLVFAQYFEEEFRGAKLNFLGRESEYPKKMLRNHNYNINITDKCWLVYGGGTQFFSFSAKSLTLFEKAFKVLKNPVIFKKKIMQWNNKIEFKQEEFKQVAFLGFGLGPFHDNVEVMSSAREKLKNATFIGVRDEVSESYCKQWHLESILGADVVFSSYFERVKQLRNGDIAKASNQRKKIGIIVRDWTWEKEGSSYIGEILNFYKNSELNDIDLQFIVFAPNSDNSFLEILKEENILVWNPEKQSIDQFMTILNGFDAFISARYHGAIIGALLGKPVICIEIEDKLKILSRQIPELKLWNKPYNLEQLKKMVYELDYEVNYDKSISVLQHRADKMLFEFKKIIIEVGD